MGKRISVLLFLFWFSIFAQKTEFIKHTVQPGETITSIARKYNITPYKIIKNNPGLKEKINPGDVILIPLSRQQDTILANAKYVGFKYHTVKENETVFSISKQYNTTIDDIIKVNKIDDYNIKLGQIIIIPILYDPYAKIDTTKYTVYLVKPKEGKWRVAYKHGITVEELENLNPEIKGKELKINQRLIVPKNKAETKPEADKHFIYYEVKPLETLYSLSKRFDISQEELIRLNPALTEGLKAGQVLKIPKKKPTKEEKPAKEDGKFIYHVVKPKETVYRITKKYNISNADLLKYNPELKEGLKAGMTLRIPRPDFNIVFDIHSPLFFRIEKILSPKEHTINLLEDIDKTRSYKFAVLLPLKLNNVTDADLDCNNPVLRSKVLDYYAGIRAATDSLKNMGVRVEYDLFDTRGSAYVTEQILMERDLSDYDFVLGPLYVNNIRKTLDALVGFNTPVVVPSFKSVSAYPNLVQTATDSASMAHHMISYIRGLRNNENVVIVYDKPTSNIAGKVASELGTMNKLEARGGKDGNWVKPEDLRKYLVPGKKNFILTVTDDLSLFANILSIAEGLTSSYDLSLFALEKPKNIEQFDIKKMAAVDFHFPSKSKLIPDARLIKFTKEKYELYVSQAYINGFDTVFDLILRLGNADNLFDGLKKYGKTEESSYIFLYGFTPESGFKNIASYIFRINTNLEPELMD
jgi:LysM repeat protein